MNSQEVRAIIKEKYGEYDRYYATLGIAGATARRIYMALDGCEDVNVKWQTLDMFLSPLGYKVELKITKK